MAIAATSSLLNSTAGAAPAAAASDSEAADRFLKLLVAQMKNQDPLNPLDNAQVTSQMAQINTVTGIEKLNGTVEGLNNRMTQQLAQLQALQGASLVGRHVIVQGSALSVTDGVGQGGFDLASPADGVKVEILGASGQVVDTLQLGAMPSGRHGFNWDASAMDPNAALRFRITAKSGASVLPVTPLMRDRVDAVSADGGTLTLELANSGSVAYGDIKAFN